MTFGICHLSFYYHFCHLSFFILLLTTIFVICHPVTTFVIRHLSSCQHNYSSTLSCPFVICHLPSCQNINSCTFSCPVPKKMYRFLLPQNAQEEEEEKVFLSKIHIVSREWLQHSRDPVCALVA